ncbi:NAD(P)/FAD-dependent oxidoreductase [Heyndrickxia sporothermodurans]|uniref:NAD(P)/FAD-dependent oxidoreductase n=1 Tax=Heyndrickxia sporothermodurans TaxID=46224 RepID=A0AB37HDM3_9BACI|nr:NAD(P)/FAD-dependent oxidoreductase [Heyndrickxia sporothermodurans]MBL5767522.1 NAD(P)/FAD-dependent oxidoreductase [Heyndrickxia sporothermodurans]MBL5770987.1 NAD(P)/FAD-dependent oxidoreductase [Heyndrickxia sporothermodurans]MBL5774657.1 NAD(P)/FAD-dependent oxidoreductase [Heyndrickxia sporothermodurans]MBL5777747.1 NAD(P)/FAD-dependent oxidoreductase [Heyndrickxia sporothermodurans]MBL5781848.1 NAD(P)/FAD-dependent oxidoreductase [Heyndrickxia sporothermodurans]
MRKPRVVILGAGYGGLMTVTRLQKLLGTNDAEIILINKNKYHYETTWLHEASAGTLHHDRVRYDIKNVINPAKVEFIQATIEKVNPEEKKVILANGEVEYDYLVISLGSDSETFGIKGLDKYAFAITNVNAARQIREHIEYQFATYNTEVEKDEKRLSIVVGGAGFTGIEFLGELTNRIPELCEEYDIDAKKVRITCIEASPMVLPQFDRDLVNYAIALLESKGVEFHIGNSVQEVTSEGVFFGKKGEEPQEIKAGTVIWSAGVRGNSVIDKSGFETMRGRVKVNDDLRIPGYEDIFVIGDCSLIINEEINRPYPPTAQIAMQHGEVCARNVAKLVQGKNDLENFVFDDKGTVCSLGEDDAIGVVFGKKIKGTKASVMKKVIDNRALFMVGGPSLVMKKGKFKLL